MSDKPVAVVTRASGDAAPLMQAIESLGVHALHLPCIELMALPLAQREDETLARLSAFHAVAFSSQMGVTTFAARWRTLSKQWPAHVMLFAVGPQTAARVSEHFAQPVSHPPISDGAHLLAWMLARLPAQSAVLLPTGKRGRRDVEHGLANHGHTPHRMELYDTRPVAGPGATPAWPAAPVYVLFASPSAVEGWQSHRPWPSVMRALSIGPSTTAALLAHGIALYRQSAQQDAAGLVETLRLSLAEDHR